MSRKSTDSGDLARGSIVCTALIAVMLTPGLASAAADEKTSSISRDSAAARAQVAMEPSYQTREERLKAKPLDWTTTIGKPKRKALSAEETKSLQGAKPETASGGNPDPKANEEARRLHPDDWNHTQR